MSSQPLPFGDLVICADRRMTEIPNGMSDWCTITFLVLVPLFLLTLLWRVGRIMGPLSDSRAPKQKQEVFFLARTKEDWRA